MPGDIVECRSDHNYIGHPLAFYWQGTRLEVVDILSEKRTPQGYTFRVLAASFGEFELVYDANTDQWSVDQL